MKHVWRAARRALAGDYSVRESLTRCTDGVIE